MGAQEAARGYQEEIRRYFHLRDGELPAFDVIHRGMGPDGHTASLFPGDPHVEDRTGVAAAVWVEKFHQWRVTLLPGVLEAARHSVMLVTGSDKAAMLETVLHGDRIQYPAQIAAHQAEWYVEAAVKDGN